jgi:hypothetical protein
MSPAYRLAYADEDFLCREELRPVRLQLELLKPEMILMEARHQVDGGAVRRRAHSRAGQAWPGRPRTMIQRRKPRGRTPRYYDEAREFARLCSKHSLSTGMARSSSSSPAADRA